MLVAWAGVLALIAALVVLVIGAGFSDPKPAEF